MEYLLGIGLAILIGYISYYVTKGITVSKNTYDELVRYYGEANVTKVKKKPFDYVVEYKGKVYLFKAIPFNKKHELNVNSKTYWQVNKGVVSSRKKGEQMKGVYDLIEYDPTSDGYPEDTKKIYVLSPGASRMMKVINECEMIMINSNTNIYGTRIISLNRLDNDLKAMK